MSNGGSGYMGVAQQVKRSDNLDWLCGRMLPRDDLEPVHFTGRVAAEIPALPLCEPEIRRRDVGKQIYGSGAAVVGNSHVNYAGILTDYKAPFYQEVQTGSGPIKVPCGNGPSVGYLPTARVVEFLSSEYEGTRLQPLPDRYFP